MIDPQFDRELESEPDLDRALADLARRQVLIDEAQRALEERTVVGRSRDRLVTVHARVLGGVSRIELHPDVFEQHDEHSLAEALLEALNGASAASGTAFEEAFGELMTLPEIPSVAPAGAAVEAVPAVSATWRPAPSPEPEDARAAAVAVAAWATAGSARGARP